MCGANPDCHRVMRRGGLSLRRTIVQALASLRLHYGILVIVAIFLLLAVVSNLLVPPFEGPDEPMHYAYVRYLAQERGLPPRDVPVVYSGSYAPLQEALQPPLYYFLSGLVTARVPGADTVEAALHRNLYFPFEAPNPWPDNKNLWLRSPSVGLLDPGFLLALRLARLVSTCLGAVAVVGAYGLGLTCFDGDKAKACLTAAWVAFNPQFVHVSGLVSNDSAAAGLAALALWITATWAIRGPSLRKAIVWGIVLGFMALTKVNALGIVPVCMIGFWMGVRGKHWSRAAKYAIGVAGMGLLVAGWWYARGALLYGDPLGLYPHLTRSPWAHEPFSISEQFERVLHVDWSYWAAFGSSIVQPPRWLLGIVVWWGRVGLLGAGVYVWRTWQTPGQKRWLVATLFVCLLIYLLAMMGWLWAFPLPLGRLMFPAAAALSVLLVMGWESWLPARWRRTGLTVMTAGLFAFAVVSLLAFLRPAYGRPPQLSTERVDALKEWPSVVFGNGARLLAGEVNPQPVHPGEWTWVRLCWESLAPLEEDHVVFLHFLGLDNRIVAERYTHTGLGTFPTSAWQPGDAFCDKIQLRVEEDAPAPAVYDIEAGLLDSDHGGVLEARGENGQVVAPVLVGRVKVWASEPPTVDPAHRTDYLLGDQIALIGYDVRPPEVRAGETLTANLYWRAERRPEADYMAFVHLLDESGNLVAQTDGPPQDGAYPTSWWEAGDELEDVREIVLPLDAEEGNHYLVVGLYRWKTMKRLPVHTGDGIRVPNGAIRLTEVNVIR